MKNRALKVLEEIAVYAIMIWAMSFVLMWITYMTMAFLGLTEPLPLQKPPPVPLVPGVPPW